VDFQLGGKVARPAGTSKGIGRPVAEQQAATGSEVAITVWTRGPLELTAQVIQSATGRRVLAGDMSVTPDLVRCAATAEDGLGPIDVTFPALPRASFIDGAHVPADGAQRKAIKDR
jgi:NAD(P)-dependent dehydrogenase (short-subunit alcohol dehydrogenase family)